MLPVTNSPSSELKLRRNNCPTNEVDNDNESTSFQLGSSTPKSSIYSRSSPSSQSNSSQYISCTFLQTTTWLVAFSIVATIFINISYLPWNNDRKTTDMNYDGGFEPPPGGISIRTVKHTTRHTSQPQTKRQSVIPPRVVILPHVATLHAIRLEWTIQRKPNYDNTNSALPVEGPLISPSWYEPNAAMFNNHNDHEEKNQDCVPMSEWQLMSFVNCNAFHELEMPKMKMIHKGGSRIAFEILAPSDEYKTNRKNNTSLSGNVHLQKFVYKTMKYYSDIDAHHIEQQRKDAVVMERTSKSRFIPDIYGYCNLAVLMDYMPEGNMHDYIKGARIAARRKNTKQQQHPQQNEKSAKKEDRALTPVERLKISIHVATSVADLHTIDGTEEPSFFHNDLCCHQYLFQNGIFKLNDFNYARPIYVHNNTRERCTQGSFGMIHWKGRSLEEHQLHLQRSEFQPPYPDKVDVWMMGNIIYYILTDWYTFEKPEVLSNVESGKLLVEGKRSPFPEYINRSKDPSILAMKKALDMCWTHRWDERPSARSISDYMMDELRRITGEDEPDLRVVLPKRDPNQRPTDSEYESLND